MKTCTKCKEEKPLTEFYKHKLTKDGFAPHCKTCHYLLVKNWEVNNPKKYQVIKKRKTNKYYKSHKDVLLKKQRDKYLKTKSKYLDSDRYICFLMFGRSGLENHIPKEIIEAKRLNLNITRGIRNEKY